MLASTLTHKYMLKKEIERKTEPLYSYALNNKIIK